jgi:hypothetical protein|tara:strand:- start:195 stop:323 length:129 start_codon:yes stop_codon:yes gene_type:complete
MLRCGINLLVICNTESAAIALIRKVETSPDFAKSVPDFLIPP